MTNIFSNYFAIFKPRQHLYFNFNLFIRYKAWTCPKIAVSKALTCLSIGSSSRAYGKLMLGNNDSTIPSMVINQVLVPGSYALFPFPGGVLIRNGKTQQIIGAVGVSGASSQEDEYCAWMGIHDSLITWSSDQDEKFELETDPKEEPTL